MPFWYATSHGPPSRCSTEARSLSSWACQQDSARPSTRCHDVRAGLG
jgi:hypothetical protein